MPDSLQKLSIRGFKSIRELENFELKNLNIFVGPNGAGKSNLISFFRMLRSLMDGNLSDFIRESGGISDLLFNGRKATKQMDFETRFGLRGYRFSIVPAPGEGFAVTDEEFYPDESFAITNEQRYYEPGTIGWWALGSSNSDRSLLAEEARGDGLDSDKSKPVYDAIRSWIVYHFNDSGTSSGMRNYEIVEDNKRLRSDASNIAPFLLRLKNEETSAYQEILHACRLAIPYLDDFLLDTQKFGPKTKVGLSWKNKGSDYPMQAYHLSDGSIRFICLAAALLQPTLPATLIIDEPELGLHPAAIEIISELIENVSKRTQIIVATQSPAFLDQFDVNSIVVVSRKKGSSIFERLDYNDYREWLEEYSVGQLWTKNVIQGGPVHE